MSRRVLIHDPPDHFLAGSTGKGPTRAFYLQAISGEEIHSVRLSGEQLRLLAERMNEVLEDTRTSDEMSGIPADTTSEELRGPTLRQPVDIEFVVGALGLGWNEYTKRLVVEAHALTEPITAVPEIESESGAGPDTLRVRLTGTQARVFCEHTRGLMQSRATECPFCHNPLDPGGHVCPRANGYRR